MRGGLDTARMPALILHLPWWVHQRGLNTRSVPWLVLPLPIWVFE